MNFSPMLPEHGHAVIRIFNEAILNSWAAFPEHPLPEAAFEAMIKMTQDYPAFVMKDDSETIVGFGFFRAFNPMPVFKRSAELSYFLSTEVQRLGYGSKLLQILEDAGRKKGIKRLIATICEKNSHSISFHIKHDFIKCGQLTEVGERKGEVFNIVLFEKEI